MKKETKNRRKPRPRHKKDGKQANMLRYPLAAVCIFLAINIFFEINDIQVEGNVLYSSQEIQEASGLQIGGSGLMMIGSLTGMKIRNALGNVTEAQVSLDIPDTVVIRVTEMVAIARLDTGKETLALSKECCPLGTERVDAAALLRITGLTPLEAVEGKELTVSEADATKLSYLKELLPLLEENGMLADVTELDVSNPSDVSFRYLGRFTVRLGKQENLSGKLNLMVRIIDNLTPTDVGTLDMYSNGKGHYIPA